jgi:hypothetical protein
LTFSGVPGRQRYETCPQKKFGNVQKMGDSMHLSCGGQKANLTIAKQSRILNMQSPHGLPVCLTGAHENYEKTACYYINTL